jgi:hypothetical protein
MGRCLCRDGAPETLEKMARCAVLCIILPGDNMNWGTTMRYSLLAGFGVAILVLASSGSQAHFQMLQPSGWLVENQLGDPQKLAPCGGTTANPGTPTNIVGEVRGGDMLHIKLRETVFHPGHYRIALAVGSRAELPPDPEVMTQDSPNGPRSVSAKIADAKRPILADGLFAHTEKQAPDAFWETDVKLPNIHCDKCTLQVIEFMAEHGHNPDGDYSYHHCADLRITANPALPIDKAWLDQ